MDDHQHVLGRLAFTVGEQGYRWADVLEAALAWSRWQQVERAAARGLAAMERLTEPITQAELEEAEQGFRYARNLLAAEEMEAWLEHWGLTTHEWSDYVLREIARGRAPGEGESSPGERDVWAEAVCSGALADLGRAL